MLMRALIAVYLQQDKRGGIKMFESLLHAHPTFVEGVIEYWKYMNSIQNQSEMERLSLKALELCKTSNVVTSDWVLSHIIRAKTFLYRRSVNKAIDQLKQISAILPPLPIEGLNYADKELAEEEETDSPENPFEQKLAAAETLIPADEKDDDSIKLEDLKSEDEEESERKLISAPN